MYLTCECSAEFEILQRSVLLQEGKGRRIKQTKARASQNNSYYTFKVSLFVTSNFDNCVENFLVEEKFRHNPTYVNFG